MKTFKDDEGREWKLSIKGYHVERLLDELQIDLGNQQHLEKIFNDTKTRLQVLVILIDDQAKAAAVTEKQIKMALGPDEFEAAGEALLDEILLFTPSPLRMKMAEIVGAIRNRRAAVQTQISSRLERAIEEISLGRLDKALGFPTLPSPENPDG